ncbi:hypothetical protein HY025_00095 [Candidatus Daviesbacteria bacterium]|nr:hypothetical protein [Candidatus Daviesbacteria bacterium]
MEKINFLIVSLEKYWWLALIVFSIPAIWALFIPGFYGASDDLHIGWLFEMDKVLRIGQIPPRFVPDLSFGFGYPLFNFVFPLPFYIGEIFHLLGLSLVDSVKGVFLVSLSLSAFTMFFLLKEFSSKFLSLAGSLIYLYTPYRSTDTYVRGAVGEALTFVFLPVLTLAFIKLTKFEEKKLNFKWIGIGSLSLLALTLSHNITIYMFFPFCLLLGILMIIFHSKQKLKSILQIFLTFFLGLLSGIYFWLPALVDSGLMKYDTVFNFKDHFPTLLQLFKPYWGYGASVPGPYDGMSFFIGISNLILFASGIILLFFYLKKYSTLQKIILVWSIISFLMAGLMMNYRSTFIWDNLPLLPYFQFPWRFLIITTFVTPIFIITLEEIKFNQFIGIFLIVLTILLSFNIFRPHDFLGRMDDYFLKRYIPTPIANKKYLEIQEEYLRLPLNTLYRPSKNYPLLNQQYPIIQNLKADADLNSQFKTISSQSLTISYNKYLFPGWKVLVDNKNVPISPGSPFGQITFKVPSGAHKISIFFAETQLKILLDLISVFGIIVSLIFSFFKFSVGGKRLVSVLSR